MEDKLRDKNLFEEDVFLNEKTLAKIAMKKASPYDEGEEAEDSWRVFHKRVRAKVTLKAPIKPVHSKSVHIEHKLSLIHI